MAEQSPLHLLFYNVLLHLQPTEIVPTDFIHFGSGPERLLTYCGNCKPSTLGHEVELITMQGFQDQLCCGSIGSHSSHTYRNCFPVKHTQCTRQDRQTPENFGLFFISSAGLLILAMALPLSVLMVEEQHSVSGSLSFTLIGSIDCYIVK